MSPKSLFLLALSIIAVCTFAYILTDSDTSDASTDFSIDGLDFKTTSDTEVKVTGFTDGTIPNLIIPTTVTNEGITYDVTEIGMSAFDLCTGLTSVNLGKVSKIDIEAFSGCISLTTVAGTELTSVGAGAFAGCILLSDISLGKVKTIGATAFAGCIKLRSVSLDKVITIGNRAFFETGLVSVTLPITTASIGTAAFNKCSDLLTINVNSVSYVSKDGAVYSRLGNLIIVNQYYILAHADYTIPSAVKSIDEFAFDGCQGLTSINVPETVTSIKGGAFINCPNLESVNILGGNSYKTVDSCVYSYDGKTLIFVPETHSGNHGVFTVPDSVEIIDSYAFSDCTSITSVDASKVSEVKSYAFSDCNGITTLYLNSDAAYSAMSLDLGSIGNVVNADIYSDKSNFLNILDLNLFTNVTYYIPVMFSLENEPEGAIAPETAYMADGSTVQVNEYKKMIPAGNIKTYLNGDLLESDSFILKDSAANVKFSYSTDEFQVLFECDNELGQFSSPSIIVAKGTTFSTEGNIITFSNGSVISASPKNIEHYTVSFSKYSADSGTVTGNMTISAEFTKVPVDDDGGSNIPIIAPAAVVAVVFLAISTLVFTGKIPLFKKD